MNEKLGCGALTIIGIFYLAIIGLMTLWTDRNLDHWATMARETETDVPLWLSFLVTLLLSPLVLGFNIISELARFFM